MREWEPDPDGTIRLIYLGEDFYAESNTLISATYRVLPDGRFMRFDWGFLQKVIIESGKGVIIHVRGANTDELRYFEGLLAEVKRNPDHAAGLVLQEVMQIGNQVHFIGPGPE